MVWNRISPYWYLLMITIIIFVLSALSFNDNTNLITGKAVSPAQNTKIDRNTQPLLSPTFSSLPRDIISEGQLNFFGKNKQSIISEAGTFTPEEKERKRLQILNKLQIRFPEVITLMYVPDYYRSLRHKDWNVADAHRDSWFRKKNDGSFKTTGEGIEKFYWLDYRADDLIDHLINFNLRMMEEYDYDGIFMDNIVWKAIFSDSNMKRNEWTEKVKRQMNAFRQAGKLVFFNGVRGPSENEENNNFDFMDSVDGVFVEHFCYLASKDRASSISDEVVEDMQFFIETLPRYAKQGKTILVNTYNLNTPLVESYQYQKFCYAAYLMMVEPNMMYRISSTADGGSVYEKSLGEYSITRSSLGNPNGEYAIKDRLYVRYFDSGVVFWNPDKTAKRVELEGYFDTYTGEAFDGIVGPMSGLILVNRPICVVDGVCAPDERIIPCGDCSERIVTDFEDSDLSMWGGASRGGQLFEDTQTQAVFLDDCRNPIANQQQCVTIAEEGGTKIAEVHVPKYVPSHAQWTFISLTDNVVVPRKNYEIEFKIKAIPPMKPINIIVEVNTKKVYSPGRRIYYRSGSGRFVGNDGRGPDMYIGLDKNIEDGAWHTIRRNIKEDIKQFFPDDEIYEARYLYVVGSQKEGSQVYIDDIKLGFSEEYVDDPSLLSFSKEEYATALSRPVYVSLEQSAVKQNASSRYQQLKECVGRGENIFACRLMIGTVSPADMN